MTKIKKTPGEKSYLRDLSANLIQKTVGLDPVRTAVVHPVDEVTLRGAVEAALANLIIPVLIGPDHKIRAVAEEFSLDLSPYEMIPTPHSHRSAEVGVDLVLQGKVAALMKGALHTDEFMQAVLREGGGLTTDRRMSHVFVMSIPHYPKLLLITDAAINIYPTLEDKQDIVQNAIDLAHAIGIKVPKVAILAAVETVSSKMKSTIDAAALCKMADRGQITGGILDGPLAFDNAISSQAALTKHISSPVSGDVDILICPDLEAANMLVKQLEYLGEAQAAGIVMGAKVPLILTSRADNATTRLASSALAVILVHKKHKP